MLEVRCTVIVTEPEYQKFERVVQIRGAKKLTPKTAREACNIGFGVAVSVDVTDGVVSYRGTPRTVRKVYY
jgi:hypothetical protein